MAPQWAEKLAKREKRKGHSMRLTQCHLVTLIYLIHGSLLIPECQPLHPRKGCSSCLAWVASSSVGRAEDGSNCRLIRRQTREAPRLAFHYWCTARKMSSWLWDLMRLEIQSTAFAFLVKLNLFQNLYELMIGGNRI